MAIPLSSITHAQSTAKHAMCAKDPNKHHNWKKYINHAIDQSIGQPRCQGTQGTSASRYRPPADTVVTTQVRHTYDNPPQRHCPRHQAITLWGSQFSRSLNGGPPPLLPSPLPSPISGFPPPARLGVSRLSLLSARSRLRSSRSR